MSWLIAILLALILIALMASDKSASAAVKKAIKIAILGVALLAFALAILAFLVWVHLVWAKEDWWHSAPISAMVLLGLALAWHERKRLAANFREDPRGTLTQVGKLIGYGALFALAASAIKLALEINEQSGWWLITGVLAFTGLVLLVRTASSPRKWREVWLGSAELPHGWEVAYHARLRAEAEEDAIREREAENWDELSIAAQRSISARRSERLVATEARLAELELDGERAKDKQLADNSKWTVRGCFWLFVLFGALGLVPLVWRYGFDWAMTLKFVRGREWLAGAVVVAGGFGIVGLVGAIWEDFDKFIRRRRDDKEKVAMSR